MKKKYRYSIFIASAILACAPLAMNNSNVVKADVAGKSARGVANNGQQGATGASFDEGTPKPTSVSDQESQPKNDPQEQGGAVKGGQQGTATSEGASQGKAKAKSESDGTGTKLKVVSDFGKKGEEVDGNYGQDYEHAYQVSVNYDQNMHTDIKLTDGLTNDDVVDYLENNVHLSINNQEVEEDEYDEDDYSDDQLNKISDKAGYNVVSYGGIGATYVSKDKDGNVVNRLDKHYVPMLLESGDKVIVTANFNADLLPNKWYSWQLHDNYFRKGNPVERAEKGLDGNLPDEIIDRIHFINGSKIIMKTDAKGHLPKIEGKPDIDGFVQEYDFGTDQIAPEVTFTITNNPEDKNASSIPHDSDIPGAPRNYIKGMPVVPSDSSKDNQDTTATDVPDDPDANKSDWDNYVEDTGDDFEFAQAEPTDVQNTIQEANQTLKETTPNVSDSKTDDEAKKIADVDGLVFIHAAFVYDGNGNVVTDKDGAYEIKRVDQKAKILDGGKTHSLPNQNGKLFYRIGKDRYIKVTNVGRVTNKVQSVNLRGTIKASHKYGVKIYNSKGKFTKKVLYNARKVSFDQKKYMHGRTFYRIKGTDTWIRSENIDLTHSKKVVKK